MKRELLGIAHGSSRFWVGRSRRERRGRRGAPSLPSKQDLRAGFSFIEIIVVMVIIAILAGVVTVNVLHKPAEAKISAARMQLQQLRTAVEMYAAEQGRIPTQEQGLEALVRKTALPPAPERYPQGGYLNSPAVPLDPWKHPYVYLVPGRSNETFEVMSYGSDGEPGGAADAVDLSSSSLQ